MRVDLFRLYYTLYAESVFAQSTTVYNLYDGDVSNYVVLGTEKKLNMIFVILLCTNSRDERIYIRKGEEIQLSGKLILWGINERKDRVAADKRSRPLPLNHTRVLFPLFSSFSRSFRLLDFLIFSFTRRRV